MGGISERLDAWVTTLFFTAAMLAVWGIGWRRQRRYPPETEEDPGIKFIDASMALLGLLLAFTFSMSLGRHEQRRAMMIADTNAIGDFYTCATLLDEPHRSALQGVIKEYAEFRLQALRGPVTETTLEKGLQRCQEMHTRMTDIVALAIHSGTAVVVPLTNTLNNLTSSHASRLAAYRERLPWSIVLLLLVGSMVPAFLMGQHQGSRQRVHVAGTFCFFFLVTLVIYVTLDLNQPTSGLITINQEPLERLVQSMAK